jgi:NAD(P)-dependent dehydrogenase (short-subunit alcohol dehydrogenase family)
MSPVAIITGGTRGLGLATAIELQRRGFDLLLVATEPQLSDKARQSLSSATRVEYLGGDITRSATADQLAAACSQKFGRLDLLVNNAGIFLMGSIDAFDEQSWDKIIAVNLKGAFLITRALVGLLKESKGQIIFINSVGGKVGLKNLSAYSASKFALRGFADSLRLELKSFAIRVTSIFPHGMNSSGDYIAPEDPRRWSQIETGDVARLIGEIATAPEHVQVPEIVIYPRSTEVSKRESTP